MLTTNKEKSFIYFFRGVNNSDKAFNSANTSLKPYFEEHSSVFWGVMRQHSRTLRYLSLLVELDSVLLSVHQEWEIILQLILSNPPHHTNLPGAQTLLSPLHRDGASVLFHPESFQATMFSVSILKSTKHSTSTSQSERKVADGFLF